MSQFQLPSVAFHFDVKILEDPLKNPMAALKSAALGAMEAGFQEISGISADLQTEEVIEGGENRFVHKLPKHVKYPNLQLKRGFVARYSDLNTWCEETILEAKFPIIPKLVVVSLLNEAKLPLMSWKFQNAYPVKYEVSGFNAETSQILVENIELAYQRFEKVALLSNAMQALETVKQAANTANNAIDTASNAVKNVKEAAEAAKQAASQTADKLKNFGS